MHPAFSCLGLVAIAGAAACGSGHASFGGYAEADATAAGLDGSADAGDGGGITVVLGEGGAPGGCTTCSSDLHQVLDCTTGQVLKTCPATAACGAGGQCVAPCDGATANKTSIGCEYYALNPDGNSDLPGSPPAANSSQGGCFVAFIANTWTSPVTVSADFAGQTLDASGSLYLAQRGSSGVSYVPVPSSGIPPGQVGLLFLAHFHFAGADGGAFGLIGTDGGLSNGPGPSDETPCPPGLSVAYTSSDAAVHGTGLGSAFHIVTSAPVVAYDIYPYGGATSFVTSATLLLPTSVWDTNYVAASAYRGEADLTTPSNVAFVAAEDQTTITILPSADIAGGAGVAPASKGTPARYVLDQGQSLQLEQPDDLSGSVVSSDKPIAAWGGHYCLFLPDDPSVRACDAAHQQIPPVQALGSEYVAVRYRDRLGASGDGESVPWRLVGAVNGTTLAYDPAAPSGAPSTLAEGQVAEFDSPGPFVVSSQDAMHPFYFAAHMTGGSLANGLGDPETVNVVTPAQFMDDYVFFTDPTYAETDLVVVRSAAGAQDVTLDCVTGPLTGWQPVGSRYEYTRVDVQHLALPVGACDNGRHEMTSSAPFGLTVWGFDQYVSYAYPAGASVKPINSVVVPATLQ